MRIGRGASLLAATMLLAGLLAGCKGFWDAPTSTSYTLSNSANMTVAPGGSGTSTITVTPGSSFTGTVSLACSITTTPTGATSPTTCGLSPTSLSFTSSTAQTSTLTASTSSSTTTGSYGITVTGTSGSVTETTALCAQVTTGSDTCSSSSGNSSGVFYVLNQATRKVAAFSITSGKLTQIGNSVTLASAPSTIAVAPSGKFLYVGTAASGIFLFSIGSNGSLTQAGSGSISQDVAGGMQVDSTGSWLVDASVTVGGVLLTATPITSTGAVNLAKQFATLSIPGTTIYQLAISPDNAHLFVAMGTDGTEDVTFAAGNASPFGGTANIGTGSNVRAAVSVAVDPSNRLLYIGQTATTALPNTGGLRVFDFNTLVEAPGSPFPSGGLAPYAILPAHSGNYVYVANRTVNSSSTGNIAAFSVATSGSTLTALGSPVDTGVNPLALAQDSTGNYLLVVNSGGNPDLEAYTFSSGALTSAVSGATGTGTQQASAIAAAP